MGLKIADRLDACFKAHIDLRTEFRLNIGPRGIIGKARNALRSSRTNLLIHMGQAAGHGEIQAPPNLRSMSRPYGADGVGFSFSPETARSSAARCSAHTC